MGTAAEVDRNQLAAKSSWEGAFQKIFYLNSFEPQLDSRKTVFIPSEPFPRIIDLAEVAAHQEGWSAILNADILIGSHLPIVEAKLKARGAKCAASWRWTFEPSLGIQSARVTDNGGDFFAATQEVWQRAHEMLDEQLRLGSIMWDSTMLSFFSSFYLSYFWNITPSRLVFHPVHGSRCYGPPVDPQTLVTYGYPVMTGATL